MPQTWASEFTRNVECQTRSELADQDIPLVHPGALFEWTIGYRTLPHGQKITESAIVFRRILDSPTAAPAAESPQSSLSQDEGRPATTPLR